MSDLESDYTRPIPVLDEGYTAGNYHQVLIAKNDPRGREPLVPIADFGVAGQSYYTRTDGDNIPYYRPIPGALATIVCRRSVAEKLAQVNRILRPLALELLVYDAYRPLACQQGLWDFFMDRFRTIEPEADEKTLRNRALEFVSDPTRFEENDPATWPTHITGGAVDLTLRNLSEGPILDLGTYFDDPSPVSHTDYFERLLRQGQIDAEDERLINRRILYNAMTAVGFVNYPAEYWHFDWGTQMYVTCLGYHTDDGPREAWYGYIKG